MHACMHACIRRRAHVDAIGDVRDVRRRRSFARVRAPRLAIGARATRRDEMMMMMMMMMTRMMKRMKRMRSITDATGIIS